MPSSTVATTVGSSGQVATQILSSIGVSINPLTKFPLSISPPGSASLNSPHSPITLANTFASQVGPVARGFAHFQLTPVNWGNSPYLNKALGSQSGIASPAFWTRSQAIQQFSKKYT